MARLWLSMMAVGIEPVASLQALRAAVQQLSTLSGSSTQARMYQALLDEFGQSLRKMSQTPDAKLKDTFDDIYRNNEWGSFETGSGRGSEILATAGIRECLGSWMAKYGVTVLLDIPCGDGNWQRFVPGIANGSVQYQGYDISSIAVAHAKEKNAAQKNMHFSELDLVNQVPPQSAGMIMVKEVIQHLPLAMGLKMLQNAKAANIKWLAVTSNPLYENMHVEPGDWFPGPNAQAPPFNFGKESERCGTLGQTGGENDFMLFDLHAWPGA